MKPREATPFLVKWLSDSPSMKSNVHSWENMKNSVKLRHRPVQIWTSISVNLTRKFQSRSPAKTLEKVSCQNLHLVVEKHQALGLGGENCQGCLAALRFFHSLRMPKVISGWLSNNLELRLGNKPVRNSRRLACIVPLQRSFDQLSFHRLA